MLLPHWSDFFEELQFVRGRSVNTVMAYRRDLELYQDFQGHFSDIGRIYEYMTKRQLSVRSQARVISSIRTYLRFIEKRGEKAPDLRQLRPPRVKVNLPQALTLEQFHKLFDDFKSHKSKFKLGIGSITITPQRSTEFDFTIPYIPVVEVVSRTHAKAKPFLGERIIAYRLCRWYNSGRFCR